MTDTAANMVPEEDAPAKKNGKLPLIIGLTMALAGACGGFFVVQSGLLPFGNSTPQTEPRDIMENVVERPAAIGQKPIDISSIAFVPVEPVQLSLGQGKNASQLRFRAQLEVNAEYQSDVEKLLPRVSDVLNSYLRAVEVSDLRDSFALTRLRAQLLRRINIVAGRDRVRDLLIMEFVLH